MTAADPGRGSRTPRIYGVLVKTYPRTWRANGRDQELLSFLLDSAATTGRTRPTLGDSLDVAFHGLGERLRTAEIVLPSAVRAPIARVCLSAGLGLSIFLTVAGELRIPGLSDGQSPFVLDDWLRRGWGPFLTIGIAVYIGWFITLARYVGGSNHGARELAAITAAITLATPALSLLTNHQRPPGGLLTALAILALGVTLLPAGSETTWRARLWPVAAGVLLALTLLAWRIHRLDEPNIHFPRDIRSSRTMFYWDPDGDRLQINRAIATPAIWLVLAAVVIGVGLWHWNKIWLPVASFLFVPALTLRLGTSHFSTPNSARDAAIWSAAALGLIVVNGVVIARVLRRPWTRRRSDTAATQDVDSGRVTLGAQRVEDELGSRVPVSARGRRPALQLDRGLPRSASPSDQDADRLADD
jgi:hypothetical protein